MNRIITYNSLLFSCSIHLFIPCLLLVTHPPSFLLPLPSFTSVCTLLSLACHSSSILHCLSLILHLSSFLLHPSLPVTHPPSSIPHRCMHTPFSLLPPPCHSFILQLCLHSSFSCLPFSSGSPGRQHHPPPRYNFYLRPLVILTRCRAALHKSEESSGFASVILSRVLDPRERGEEAGDGVGMGWGWGGGGGM